MYLGIAHDVMKPPPLSRRSGGNANYFEEDDGVDGWVVQRAASER